MAAPPAHLKSLLDALHCGAALVDRHGVYAHVNPRLAEMHGQPADQLIGQPVAQTYAPSQAPEQLGRLLQNFESPAEGELFIQQPGGTTLPVVFGVRPFALSFSLNTQDHANSNLNPDTPSNPAEFLVVTVLEISQQRQTLDQITELSDTMLTQALRLRDDNHDLEARVRRRTEQLHQANMTAITMLAVASEARDEDTGNHVRRIEAYTFAVAQQLGLSESEAERLGYSSILHDVGKIHVPDHILKKPGQLTTAERAQMQEHTLIGERILSDNDFFAVARQIARHHHENHDGTGYPDGLSADEIPLPARIVHVVDVFDALASTRVYKDAWPPEKARDAIVQGRGTLFDPTAADAFLTCLDQGTVQLICRAAAVAPGGGPGGAA
ncbi:MAG: HD domain-containing phosphohydrolase, partial [Planctomycetota bacterium]